MKTSTLAGLHALLLAAAAVFVPARALDVTTEENAPFNYLDSQQRIAGISTEIVLELGRRAGIPMKIQLTPWARAYQLAINMPDTCVYSTARLPERETLFKWIGPISTNKWALFARGDFNQRIDTLDDARKYRIGGVVMDAKVTYLKSLGFATIDPVNDDTLNVAKLLAGRIDLWVAGLYKGKELIGQSGAKNIKPVFVVREVEYYLACSQKTSDAIVNALAAELQVLQKEGFLKAVAERYANRLH
ncbi:MAG TPA: transporter substrate-binding domain-containing protein [Paucimonas sp.]|nr:transporter substrate-binding domain-containing protein [Paucimonas sp.]